MQTGYFALRQSLRLGSGDQQNIINAEVKKLSSADTETKLATLGSKMKTLGRTYAQSEQFFPLEFLVKTLETYSVRWNGPPGKFQLFLCSLKCISINVFMLNC
jgi:hypothetical protein